jgi:hypothetical protein
VSGPAWIITRDHLDGGNASGAHGPRGITEDQLARLHDGDGAPLRLYDADGVLCFEGRLLGDPATRNGFAPLDEFGRGWAGCTAIRYRNPATGHWDEL